MPANCGIPDLRNIEFLDRDGLSELRDRLDDLGEMVGLDRCWEIIEQPTLLGPRRQAAYMLTVTQAATLDTRLGADGLPVGRVLGRRLTELASSLEGTAAVA